MCINYLMFDLSIVHSDRYSRMLRTLGNYKSINQLYIICNCASIYVEFVYYSFRDCCSAAAAAAG